MYYSLLSVLMAPEATGLNVYMVVATQYIVYSMAPGRSEILFPLLCHSHYVEVLLSAGFVISI